MTDAPPAWDPQQYSRFEAERDRAPFDLPFFAPARDCPREIWDWVRRGPARGQLKRRIPATVHDWIQR
jgi:trans-aconitate 2-methyltransferase